jgi:hypothetical protein
MFLQSKRRPLTKLKKNISESNIIHFFQLLTPLVSPNLVTSNNSNDAIFFAYKIKKTRPTETEQIAHKKKYNIKKLMTAYYRSA